MIDGLVIDIEELFAEGYTVEEIAKMLGVAESIVKTVEEELENI